MQWNLWALSGAELTGYDSFHTGLNLTLYIVAPQCFFCDMQGFVEVDALLFSGFGFFLICEISDRMKG